MGYYTVKQLAENARVNEETVRRWIRSGKVNAIIEGGSKNGYCIPCDDPFIQKKLYSKATKAEPKEPKNEEYSIIGTFVEGFKKYYEEHKEEIIREAFKKWLEEGQQ